MFELDPHHKVRSIITLVLIGIVLVLALAWLWAGGWSLIRNAVRQMPNPIDIIRGNSDASYEIHFPWEISAPRGADISGLIDEGNAISGGSAEEQLADFESQYKDIQTQLADLRALGAPSPYRGSVVLIASNARANDPEVEYVELENRGSGAVAISGWSIQSMITGKRSYVPQAAQPYVQGQLNRVSPVTLDPRGIAILVTGASPVGVSFRETLCTGYLAQAQSFAPELANACPSPLEAVPESIATKLAYGPDCFEYMRDIPQCQYVSVPPLSLSAQCRALVATEFSYNGCVSENQRRSDFTLGTWRLYLASGIELWNNQHDIIRLVDDAGRTVDAISY